MKLGLKLTNFSRKIKMSRITYFSVKKDIISNKKTVANKFNDYFIIVVQSLLKDLGESKNEFQDYLKNPNNHSFFLKEVDSEKVHKLLLKIYTEKSSDIFGISHL